MRPGMLAGGVDPEQGVEDLRGGVRVQSRDDLGDDVEVPIEELAEPEVVLHRPQAGLAGDEELVAGNAERVLTVHDHQTDSQRVGCGGRNPVAPLPGAGLVGPLQVWHSPDRSHRPRLKVRRNGKLSHVRLRFFQTAQKGSDARQRTHFSMGTRGGVPTTGGSRRTSGTPQRVPQRANAADGPFSAAC